MIRPSRIFDKSLRNLREHGVFGLMKTLPRHLFKKLGHGNEYICYIDCERIADEDFLLNESMTIDIVHRKDDISREDLESLRNFVIKNHMKEENVEYYLDNLLSLFRDGGVLWLLRKRGILAAYFWSINNKGNYTPYFYFFPLCEGDTVLFAALTLHDWRGHGLLPALIRYATVRLKKEGMKRIFSSCKVWNRASHRTMLKSGYVDFATARKMDILGQRIVLWGKPE
jgi:hypothetical protein